MKRKTPMKRSSIKRKKPPAKKKRPKKSNRRKLNDSLDKAYSEFIRLATIKEFGGCVFCGKPVEHCFHFVGRGRYAVRWSIDPVNAVGSCAGCNLQETFNSAPFQQWYIHKFGLEQWEELVNEGKQIAGHSVQDLEDMLKELQEMAQELKDEGISL